MGHQGPGQRGFGVGGGINYVGDRFASGNTVTLPGYTTVDAMAYYRMNGVDMQHLQNLFDRRYIVAGRGTSPNLNLPGAPRSVQLLHATVSDEVQAVTIVNPEASLTAVHARKGRSTQGAGICSCPGVGIGPLRSSGCGACMPGWHMGGGDGLAVRDHRVSAQPPGDQKYALHKLKFYLECDKNSLYYLGKV